MDAVGPMQCHSQYFKMASMWLKERKQGNMEPKHYSHDTTIVSLRNSIL